MKLLKLTVLLATLVLPASQSFAQNTSVRLKINDVYVVHFILDGLNLKTFKNALEQGKLPNIKQHFVENGAVFQEALSSFPTTSTTIYQSFTTGLMPGHSGIPHLERFDRQNEEVIGYLTASKHTMINSDLINLKALTNPDVVQIDPPTAIFELLKGYPTAAIYSSFYKDAAVVYPKIAPVAALWSTYVSDREEHVDILAMRKVLKLFGGEEEKIPRYTLAGLYSSDILGHKHGPYSEEVSDVLVQFDLFLKDFLALLEKQGIADKTYIIISADHGMHESGELFELGKALQDVDVVTKPKNPRLKKYSLYVANRGVASSHLYVRHDGGFKPLETPEILKKHPTSSGGTIDLIETLLGFEATDLLIVRAGARKADIYNKDGGKASVSCYTINLSDYCSYKIDTQLGDPLDYIDNPKIAPLMDGKPHPTREWLEASADDQHPDAVIQLSQIFHDGRAGDIFVTTRNRFGFRKVKEGNHGGAGKDDMQIPMLISGRAVPHGNFGAMRPQDIYPLLLKWFNISVPAANYDGRDPFDKSKSEDPALLKLAQIEQAKDEAQSLVKMIDVRDFIKEKIYPIVKPAEFKKMLLVAQKEEGERAKLKNKLHSLLKSLELQKTDKHAPKIAEAEYLEDHMEIVRGTLKWAEGALGRMEDIVTIFSKCENLNSGDCHSL